MATIIQKMNELARNTPTAVKFNNAKTYAITITDKEGNFIRQSLRTRLTDAAGNTEYVNFPKSFDISKIAEKYDAKAIIKLTGQLEVICMEKEKDGVTYKNYYYIRPAIEETV